MNDPWTTLEFAHVRDAAGLMPAWAQDRLGVHGSIANTLQDTIGELRENYGVEAREVAFDDPETGWTETGRHQALVNPAWLGEAGVPDDIGQDTALWHIPTQEYTPVGPMDMYGPLLAVLCERDYEAEIYGQARLYRNGGEVHIDLWNDAVRFGDSNEVVLGIQTGYDYFGGRALYSQIVAYDTEADTVMRSLTEKYGRRHTGAAGAEVADWWDDTLDRLEKAESEIGKVMGRAQEYEIDFEDLPFGPEQYAVEVFGGVEYLGEQTAEYLPTTEQDATLTAHEVYRAMAHTLTHDFRGKDGSTAIRQHNRKANKQLFNPASAESDVLESVREQMEGQETLEGEDALAELRERRQSLGEAVDEYADTREELKRLLREMPDSEAEAV